MAVQHVAEFVAWVHVRPLGQIKLRNDPRHFARQSFDRILEGWPFVGRRPHAGAIEDETVRVLARVKRLTIENLELYEMDMDRMRIFGDVDEAPDFHRSRPWRFSYRIFPWRIDQSDNWVAIGLRGVQFA